MARTLEFYYDYGSPYSYLADTQVEAIAKRVGASLLRKPMLLGGVFKATGNASPMTASFGGCPQTTHQNEDRHPCVSSAPTPSSM